MTKLSFALTAVALIFVLGTQAAAQTTPYPSPQASIAPAPTAEPTTMQTATPKSNRGLHLGQLKKLLRGTLSTADLRYAVTHQSIELAKVKAMKRVSFAKIRILHLTPAQLQEVKAWKSHQAFEPFQMNDTLAQTSNPFLNIFANVVVTNALNNILNNNNVNVSLNDILNYNNIGIGSVVGVFVNSLGIITTIVGG